MIFEKNLGLFYFSAFLKSQMFLLPVLYLFYLANGLTMADYFLFQGIIVLVNVFLQVPAGFIGDKIARKHILLISYTLFLGRIFCWFFWKGPWIVFIGEFLYAISKALFDTVESPILYDMLDKDKKDRMVKAYSLLNFVLSLGTAIAALSGAWLYEKIGLKILLGSEFIFITAAIFMATRLPYISPERKTKYVGTGISDAIRNSVVILKNPTNSPYILYSGLIVSFSHFFFWSFQPMMKMAAVPVGLFGVVMFTNNTMRSLGSLLTHRLLKYIRLDLLGRVVFACNGVCLFIGWAFQKIIIGYWGVCLVFIFLLCVCITLQLMFTIAQISRLQQVADSEIRTQIAATNMMVARFCVAVLLIIPKYLTNLFPLMTLYLIYGILFISAGWFLSSRLPKSSIQ